MASEDVDGGGGKRVSDLIPFSDVAKLLERISCAGTIQLKKGRVKTFFECCRNTFVDLHNTLESSKAGGDSLFPVVRILLPELDRGRPAYGFQSAVLSKMFVDVLGLGKGNPDWKRLMNFHGAGEDVNENPDDLGTVISQILERGFSSRDASKKPVMLKEIHEVLDKLAETKRAKLNEGEKESVRKRQVVILRKLIKRLTVVEGKWLVRILLKDLQLGMISRQAAVLDLLHEQAYYYSERVGELELICRKMNDPKREFGEGELDISLNAFFYPMLATRMDLETQEGDGGTKKGKYGVVTLPPPPFLVETKWDGERFQIHYDGKSFKYISRGGHDFSSKFNESLTPRLKPRMTGSCRSFILDGEMMVFDKNSRKFMQKGERVDVKSIKKDNPKHCPVFVAYDLVYYNGNSWTNERFCERREKLAGVFKTKEDVICLSQLKTMNTKDDVKDALNAAVRNDDEGLVVKDMNSKYEPGRRGKTWLKIKPDFDLIVLGANLTKSNKIRGRITSFLLGLMDKSKGRGEEEYYPVTNGGPGFLKTWQLRTLVEELTPKLVKTPFPNVHHTAKSKPDFYIDPSDSIVIQVQASEITRSDVFALGYTLRFPVVIRIRKDKRPIDVTTIDEFQTLRIACNGKLAKRSERSNEDKLLCTPKNKRKTFDYDTDDETDDACSQPQPPPLKKSSRVTKRIVVDNEEDDDDPLPGPSLMRPLIKPRKLFHNSSDKSCGNIFNAKVFCVYGSSKWKVEMEGKIKKHGGDISQSPDVSDIYVVVGEKKESVMVDKAIRSGKYNVISSDWIQRCIESGKEVPFVRGDYWGMTLNTKKKFQADLCDTKENTPPDANSEDQGKSGIEATLQKPDSVDDSETDFEFLTDSSSTNFSGSPVQLGEVCKNVEKKEEIVVLGDFMANTKIALRGPFDGALIKTFKCYGGTVAASEDEQGVDNIVVSAVGLPSRENHPRAFVVTQKWLEDSLEEKEVLPELLYSAI